MEAVRDELIKRGETIAYEDKRVELKETLVKLLKGDFVILNVIKNG